MGGTPGSSPDVKVFQNYEKCQGDWNSGNLKVNVDICGWNFEFLQRNENNCIWKCQEDNNIYFIFFWNGNKTLLKRANKYKAEKVKVRKVKEKVQEYYTNSNQIT